MVSIPLGYFGGIGAASTHGILFKGAHFLDLFTTIKTVVLDKTGTLTKGVFKIQQVESQTMEKALFLNLVAALESQSTHPIARAITASNPYAADLFEVEEVEEISGHGIKGIVKDYEVMAGNTRLLKKFGISYPDEIEKKEGTNVLVAINRQFAGYILISDEIREDAVASIQELRKAGIRHLAILSGDHSSSVNQVAKQLQIDEAYGDLLPEDKMKHLETIKNKYGKLAFAGDGINDAPALALADVGIAMGGLGTDAAIETADVVIQTDQPSKIATAIRISKATRNIVWQNISLALGVKIAVLVLGAGGVASLWEAVFADVGVAILAILNAVRIQRMKF
jgi:Cd2+/Zn2+-exporting ATPase